jgi:hypothetical protein
MLPEDLPPGPAGIRRPRGSPQPARWSAAGGARRADGALEQRVLLAAGGTFVEVAPSQSPRRLVATGPAAKPIRPALSHQIGMALLIAPEAYLVGPPKAAGESTGRTGRSPRAVRLP